ncbi:MAG TPA: hypothetical protein VNY27_12430 [Solirubrobacteraceae bacterium]|nr:hypothetical protein [Solirubrobacteraceae bacterium]
MTIYSVTLGCAVGVFATLAIRASLPWLAAVLFLLVFLMPLLLPGEDNENNGEAEQRSGPAVDNGKNGYQDAAHDRGRNETFPGTTLIRP